jgi:hypothetical protein
MNRNLARMLVAAGLTSVVVGTGCQWDRTLVDRCWPERYNHTARRETVDAFAPQVQNGHVLDQTIWNYMFVTGKDELNGQGKYKLDYMIRRRPQPDPNIFLQTAHDVQFDAKDPDKFAESRRDLDQKRAATVRQYMNAQTVGRPMQFELAIHDPFEVGSSASYAGMKAQVANSANGGSVIGGGGGGGGGSGSGGGSGTGGGAATGSGAGYGGVGGSGTTAPGGSGSGSGSGGSGSGTGGSGSGNIQP